MPVRKPTAAAALTASLLALTVSGCGKDADDLFSNLNGTASQRSEAGSAAAPNPEDAKKAVQKRAEVERALDKLRRRGTVAPADVRRALTDLAGRARVSVDDARSADGAQQAEGSEYGIWIGATACVTGAMYKDRVRAYVNGRYPATGCLPPGPVG
ncbi:hypothetical protein [Streptomyces sp. NPDC059009]|uniref:hypothetical protein n=1 Tax=Streptomyces sp. NPDC059009 TaxID=3346694 RepID=UPI00369BE22F